MARLRAWLRGCVICDFCGGCKNQACKVHSSKCCCGTAGF